MDTIFFHDLIGLLEQRKRMAETNRNDPRYSLLAEKTLEFLRDLERNERSAPGIERQAGGVAIPTEPTRISTSLPPPPSTAVLSDAAGSRPPARFQYPSDTIPDCSICLDGVVSEEHCEARLLCGHIFHLTCIGSAFNSTGVMQCPTCRRLQENQPGGWKYAAMPIRIGNQYHPLSDEAAAAAAAGVGGGGEAEAGVTEMDFSNFQREYM
ncbi:hypothetical protein BC937DRAFT_90837 [Endogone sp. FLAS-F59071]|nr:hypothetical protein BC937DRAFT_90837 [Endogone sp. FLAS-F59071]|eukprot:RUS16759.1 hypothetical protein BC937DRAFT_90837 [Endogone sp. FLAS-F59071]